MLLNIRREKELRQLEQGMILFHDKAYANKDC